MAGSSRPDSMKGACGVTSEILRSAWEIQDRIVAAKRRIHSLPELGMKEFETTALVRSELESVGIPMIPLDGPVGVLGVLRGKGAGDGKVIALRADMDALPIQETADVPDRSTVPGIMHACGHDCHTAMLLGAARLLASRTDEFSGTVKFLFQPAEETLGGAKYMIEQGVLEGPKVDWILGIHGHPGFDVGEIAFRSGPSMASSDFFTVTMTGKSGHGAYPHRLGCDPVLAASNAILAIQSIITRQIDAIDSVVISVCEIHGGTAKNIIPEAVQFGGSVRCQSPETRSTIEGRILDIARNVAATYRCTADLDYHYGVPPLVNDPDVVEAARASAVRALGSDKVKTIDIPAMGSEDFAEYLQVVPAGAFARLGVRPKGGESPVFHNGGFIFPEDALPCGAAFFAQFVLDVNGTR